MELTIEEIKLRLESSNLPKESGEPAYVGFNMSKTHSQEQENNRIEEHNKKILKIFQEYLPRGIETYFDCWKGTCFVAENKNPNLLMENFGGWTTEDILLWISKNKSKFNTAETCRIISKEKRYEVLRRQKWRCNTCNEPLKYNSHSQWEGKTAHIDHIFPYSKRKDYLNGEENINELSNLQALCPNCNLTKGGKDIQ